MDSWQLVKKELAFYGIHFDGEKCQSYNSNGNLQTKDVAGQIKELKKQIDKKRKTFCFLWRESVSLLMEDTPMPNASVDARSSELFAHALKDLAKLLDIFDDLDDTSLKKVIHCNLAKDITEFGSEQINLLPNFQIGIAWLHRELNKCVYLIDLLRFAAGGELYTNSYEIKTARGISGPWSNLDLPMLERVWPWQDEDENLRGRMKDIRNLSRYRMGLENYNNSDGVGEGFYWRELRNEPYSWYDRKDEEPYYERYALSKG